MELFGGFHVSEVGVGVVEDRFGGCGILRPFFGSYDVESLE